MKSRQSKHLLHTRLDPISWTKQKLAERERRQLSQKDKELQDKSQSIDQTQTDLLNLLNEHQETYQSLYQEFKKILTDFDQMDRQVKGLYKEMQEEQKKIQTLKKQIKSSSI